MALAENAPQGITEPSVVSDEQNSIEVYKALSPGVASITTTSYQQDMFGEVDEGRGSGSGSVIDAQGHILTNYHVIEGAQVKLNVSLGGGKRIRRQSSAAIPTRIWRLLKSRRRKKD